MLRDRNIAFFVDVDNVGLSSEQYADVIERLRNMGSILSGKIYGAGERKHKEIYADADLCGYATVRPMRIKRRGRKDFDARIFVDVVDAVTRAPAIDTVCIVAQPTDLVHLYSYLHARGVKIVALANADEASNALIDEVLDLGLVAPVAKPVKKPAAKPAPKAEPAKEEAAPQEPVAEQAAPAEESGELDRTDELLREIERLRNLANTPVNESEPESVEEPASVEEAAPEDESAEDAAPTSAPRASYTPSNERDLIRRIEEIRRNNQGDDEDFIDEIKKLLDGLE